MRLDKFIAEQTGLTRSQAAKALKSGVVSVNEEIEKVKKEIKDNGVFLPNTMSRKKQIVPPILGAMK